MGYGDYRGVTVRTGVGVGWVTIDHPPVNLLDNELLGDLDTLSRPPAQVALAWLYASGTRLRLPVVPIPGTRRASRVEENIASLAVSLDAGQLRALDGVAAQAAGARSDNPDPDWVSDTREAAPAPRPGE